MTASPRTTPPKPRHKHAHRKRRRPPFFAPVPLRGRKDGWSVARQAAFLGQLYITGCVRTAARRVGMAARSAYRLRARAGAEEFASAWDFILQPPGSARRARPGTDWRKVPLHALMWQVETGRIRPVVYRGRVTAIHTSHSFPLLMRLLRRADAVEARADAWAQREAAKVAKNTGVCVTPHTGSGRAELENRHCEEPQATRQSSEGSRCRSGLPRGCAARNDEEGGWRGRLKDRLLEQFPLPSGRGKGWVFDGCCQRRTPPPDLPLKAEERAR